MQGFLNNASSVLFLPNNRYILLYLSPSFDADDPNKVASCEAPAFKKIISKLWLTKKILSCKELLKI
jgi:hypothetical protein